MVKNELKLDIGCGGRGTMFHNLGFIGIDKHPEPKEQRQPGAKYIQLDFVYDRLPWPENSVDEIVCFHVIEHLSRKEGIDLLSRIHFLLKPGKQAFISCPDTRLFVQKYIDNDLDFYTRKYPSGKEMWPGGPLLDRLFRSMYDNDPWGHRTPYDLATLWNTAKKAGWIAIQALPNGRFEDNHLYGDKPHFWSHRPDHETGLILTK